MFVVIFDPEFFLWVCDLSFGKLPITRVTFYNERRILAARFARIKNILLIVFIAR